MMGTEMVPETSVLCNQLTRLIAPEVFTFSRHESFTSYIFVADWFSMGLSAI
jgi:hypothetical protein